LDRGADVSGGSEVPGSAHLGEDLGRLANRDQMGVAAVEAVADAARGADVWVDFTTPAATLAALGDLPSAGVRAAVIGTTGFTDAEMADIADAAKTLAIVKAGNFSLGVTVLCDLVARAASALDTDWDIEIDETHHRHKVDAPSGTALMIGDAAAKGRGGDLSALRQAPYDGRAAKRTPGGIGFSVRRAGGVIGDHEALFGAEKEVLRLSHTALDRSVFADGAVKAARWLVGRAPGLYDLRDVLGLNDPC
ncbi:MAG: 4-hydroxy-tetrahydrodipicolinate reductase, partial [Pseudomonadota bacterium]